MVHCRMNCFCHKDRQVHSFTLLMGLSCPEIRHADPLSEDSYDHNCETGRSKVIKPNHVVHFDN